MPANADEVLKNVKVPLGGDLLGRERITGAKKTRLGWDSAAERFESIVEMPALWHAKQSFLGVSFNNLIILFFNHCLLFFPGLPLFDKINDHVTLVSIKNENNRMGPRAIQKIKKHPFNFSSMQLL